jgi:hypothetical protein
MALSEMLDLSTGIWIAKFSPMCSRKGLFSRAIKCTARDSKNEAIGRRIKKIGIAHLQAKAGLNSNTKAQKQVHVKGYPNTKQIQTMLSVSTKAPCAYSKRSIHLSKSTLHHKQMTTLKMVA